MDVKKIAIFVNSLESGGAERVISNLLNLWAEDYECYLILIHNYKFYELDKRVKIISLDEPKEFSGFVKLLRLPILAYKLSKIIQKNKFDKIVSFLTRANYINIISNVLEERMTELNSLSEEIEILNEELNKFTTN